LGFGWYVSGLNLGPCVHLFQFGKFIINCFLPECPFRSIDGICVGFGNPDVDVWFGGRDVVVGLVGVGMADIEAIVVHVVSRNERLHVTINDLWYKEECKESMTQISPY